MIRVSVLNTLGKVSMCDHAATIEQACEWLRDQVMGSDVRPSLGRPTMAVIYDLATQQTTHVIITRDDFNRVLLAPFGPELYNSVRRIVLDLNRWFETCGSQPLPPFAQIHQEDEPVKEVVFTLAESLVRQIGDR